MNKIALVGLGVLGVAMLGIAGVFGHRCGKNSHYVSFVEGCECDEGYSAQGNNTGECEPLG